jgi:hypothetical protein
MQNRVLLKKLTCLKSNIVSEDRKTINPAYRQAGAKTAEVKK